MSTAPAASSQRSKLVKGFGSFPAVRTSDGLALDRTYVEMQEMIWDHEEKIRDLEEDVWLIRGRFFSTFIRDHLPEEFTQADRETIAEGNRLAHDAYPARDVEMCLRTNQHRHDFDAIYGLAPLCVERMSESSQYPVGS